MNQTTDLCIYTLTHKQFDVPPDPLYQPLHVGRAGAKDLGYMGDHTGDHISHLNCYYSELTGLYWIWKNAKNTYVGTCHYRRYLLNRQEKIFNKNEYLELLKTYDIITTKQVILNHSYKDAFSANHNGLALEMTGKVIAELYPKDGVVFEELVNQNRTYFGNILVAKKEIFDAYCAWLFSVFFQVQKRINLETGEDAYHKRVFGFISEFLLLVFVRARGLLAYECKVGMLGEKAETAEIKKGLAGYFLARDVEGAKAYFLARKKERPDVTMEASDVTGELHLCMQIIAAAGLELQRTGEHLLQKENRYDALISLFARQNGVVSAWCAGNQTKEDLDFLQNKILSDITWEVAVAIAPGTAKQKERWLHELLQCRKKP